MKKIKSIQSINPILFQLKNICAKYPRDEKILITPDYRVAQQVLQALARSGTPWMNFQLAAASALAHDAAEEAIISGNLQQISGPGILTVIDDIFNDLADKGKLKYFEKHQTNIGIIHALTSVVMELRTKGIHPINIKGKDLTNKDKAYDVKLILSEYERVLKAKGLIDKAELTALAIGALEKSPPARGKKYVIFSRYYMSGLERDFIEKLTGKDLLIIDDGPVFGLPAPKGFWETGTSAKKINSSSDIERLSWAYACGEAPKIRKDGTLDLFSAIGFRNEIREIFRRVAQDDTPVDKVEIVYTDPATYIREIFSFCEKLGIPATFAEGIPGNTRSPFRAISGFLLWIKHDFAECYLRRIFESEDMDLSSLGGKNIPDSPTLGHMLRISGVGWGRERYSYILAKKQQEYAKRAKKPSYDDKAELADANAKKADNFDLLKTLCADIIEMVPKIDSSGKIDLLGLTRGCIRFLNNYAQGSLGLDASFIKDAVVRLEMIGRFASGSMDVEEATEKLLGTIATIKVGASGPRPGSVHVSYYKQGGRSGRQHTFVTGLDESRFPGRGLQDPVLLDSERVVISGDMEVSADKVRKNVYDMASMLSGLRGAVTASFSCFNVSEERNVFPSSVMLQLYRIKEGNPASDYEDLLKSLEPAAATVSPDEGSIPLDVTEWWVDRLSDNGVLSDGTESICGIYPGVKHGLAAERARDSEEFTEYDGKVSPQGEELDPRDDKEKVLSCSRLEAAATCPYKYFLANVLGVAKPEETVKDPALWLNAKEKGSLLHEVFENFTKEIRTAKGVPTLSQQRKVLGKILKNVIEKYKKMVPPPSDVVFEGECVQLERDTDIFLRLNEQLKTKAVHEELAFGTGDADPVKVSLGNGKNIYLRGFIDRVDRAGKHEYHVWDYKTGSAGKYERRQYVDKGKQLQHALYADAAETMLIRSGEDPLPKVTRSGYLLPSEKGAGDGKGGVFSHDPSKKKEWQGALNTLLEILSSGGFLMPAKVNCSFCDYAVICGDKKTHERSKTKEKSDNICIKLWGELQNYA
ncbi:MAG: PD-(D/E)XK nuclease family protein [Candidatus Tantalella remota]|nr:PD-(D/E)XK nuclease family protein [Candidatus Tantalella remota]